MSVGPLFAPCSKQVSGSPLDLIKQVSPLNEGAATQTAVTVTCRVNAKPSKQAASAEHAVSFVVYITSGDGDITTEKKKNSPD